MRTSLRVPASLRRLSFVGSHLVVSALALFAAVALHFELRVPAEEWSRAFALLPLLLLARLVTAFYVRLDRVYWAHVGMPDLLRLVWSGVLGTIVLGLFLLLAQRTVTSPVPVVLTLELLLLICGSSALAVAARWLHESRQTRTMLDSTRAFILGAGEAGEQLLRQLQHDTRHQVSVVGLLDDDPHKRDRALHGVEVLGPIDDVRRLAAVHRVTMALVAIPSVAPEQLRRIVEFCRTAGVSVKLLPPLRDLISEDVTLNQLREVQLADLLGRAPIELNTSLARGDLAGRVVLVTGAAGSIGSELVRQIAEFRPRTLILVDRAESPLHAIHLALLASHPHVEVIPVLGSVTNAARLDRLMQRQRPDFVFHAAAYKQLPMLEWNVVEGIWNNVIGTLNTAQSAARCGAKRFVLISTDKAVNPSSVLGVTKLLAERVVLDLPGLRASPTDFRVVRFGNVLGSEGSVVPLFTRQLAAGGPLTITHPDVRRYFMTIPEAAQLVLEASSLEDAAGQISLLEMGEQVRIQDLAEQMIRLAGRIPHEDIRIVYTGLRPGEKLEEELVAPGEVALPTTADKIRRVTRTAPDHGDLERRVRQLATLALRGDDAALVRALASLAPEYQPTSLRHEQAPPPKRRSPRPAARPAVRREPAATADLLPLDHARA